MRHGGMSARKAAEIKAANKFDEKVDTRSLSQRVKDLESQNRTLTRYIQKQHDELELVRLDVGILTAKIGD